MGWGTSPRGEHTRGKYRIMVYTRNDEAVDYYQTSVREYISLLMESAHQKCERLDRSEEEAAPHYIMLQKNMGHHDESL